MSYVIEADLMECSLPFRESVSHILKKPGPLSSIAAYLPPSELRYKDGYPSKYSTSKTESNYIIYSEWVEKKPEAAELKKAAIAILKIFDEFRHLKLPTSFFTLQHFAISSSDASDVRFLYIEPFSLHKAEAIGFGRDNEPDLSETYGSDADFALAIQSKIVEKVLLSVAFIWDSFDYPNRAYMSQGLLSAFQKCTFTPQELIEAIELGYLAQSAHQSETKKAAQSKQQKQKQKFRKHGTGALLEDEPENKPLSAFAPKTAAQERAADIRALYVILAKGEGSYESRLAYHRQAKSIAKEMQSVGCQVLSAYLTPVPGSDSLTSYTGFLEPGDLFLPSLAASSYSIDNTHVLAKAYSIALSWARGGADGRFVCLFIDNNDSYRGYGRNYALMLSKFKRLEEANKNMSCFYLCGERKPSEGESVQMANVDEIVKWIRHNLLPMGA